MTKILVLSRDVVGTTMAGPGIRSVELARSLAPHHEVTLAVPAPTDLDPDGFIVHPYTEAGLRSLVAETDITVTQNITPGMLAVGRRHGTRFILDAYDPLLLELLEVHRVAPDREQRDANRWCRAQTSLSFVAADAIICASEKQRDLWLGMLMASDRLRPAIYREDPSLRNLIDVVPFGLPPVDPQRTGDGFRARLGIAPTDRVLIWGGGVWDWFDPLTLIHAMHEISQSRGDVKLVFMGLRHPNPEIGASAMAVEAMALAYRLGLTDRFVYFNEGWVPYGERQNHLLEADLGVSTHLDHLETRFSFRTRLLDYFWALLPVVTTEGDGMADLVQAQGLGCVVRFGDVHGLAQTVLDLLDDPQRMELARQNLQSVREEFRWHAVSIPLLSLIDRVASHPSKGCWSEVGLSASLFWLRVRASVGRRGVLGALGHLGGRAGRSLRARPRTTLGRS